MQKHLKMKKCKKHLKIKKKVFTLCWNYSFIPHKEQNLELRSSNFEPHSGQ